MWSCYRRLRSVSRLGLGDSSQETMKENSMGCMIGGSPGVDEAAVLVEQK